MIISMKNQVEILDDTIASLQIKRKENLLLLKAQLDNVTESLKPTNLLKIAQKDIVNFVEHEGEVFNNMVKLGTKQISNKIYSTISQKPILKFLNNIFK